jgi:hypothetical protein
LAIIMVVMWSITTTIWTWLCCYLHISLLLSLEIFQAFLNPGNCWDTALN